jgi:peptidoglycan L-alanyl-D-glutamate endopeptidase CwlK
MDQISLDRIELLHPSVREEAKEIYKKITEALTGRASCRFTQTLRTFKEQDDLFAKGRTKLFSATGKRVGKVTNAKGGQSYHNYGLAIDFCLVIDGKLASWDWQKDFDNDKTADWMEVVNIFKSYGWEWGGEWKFIDRPHFQKTFGLSTKELLKRHNNKNFIPGTTYVNI